MKRALLVLASSILIMFWLAALPAYAAPQTYRLQGFDTRRGPYTGELTLDERTDGKVDATRRLTFKRSGQERVQTGVLRKTRGRLRGVLRESRGIAGHVRGRRRGSRSLVSIQVLGNTVRGAGLYGFGTGSFVGSAAGHDPSELTGDKFAGKPVVDYDPAKGIKDPKGVAYRLRVTWENEDEFGALLDTFLADPRSSEVEAVLFGYWGGYGTGIDDAIKKMVDNKAKLASLNAIFVGDIDQEESEISWIEQGNLGPLLQNFPKLKILKVRGGNSLSLGQNIEHKQLETLIVESGGMSGSVLREVGSHKLPQLKHLELWLGSDEYGWDGNVSDAAKILAGKGLPKLEFLGLMNSMIADDLAKAAVASPIIKRIKTLDLSMGTMTDVGGEALLASTDAKKISLNLEHHYMSDAVMARFAAEGFTASVGEQQEVDPDYPEDRYVAVGE